MTTTRAAYAALTPDHTTLDFSLPDAGSPSPPRRPTLGRAHAAAVTTFTTGGDVMDENEDFEDDAAPERHPGSRMKALWKKAVENVRNNAGLLLVAAAQVFFSLVNVAVKKLNSIDPPVSALELIVVRMTITYVCCVTYMLIAKVPDPFLGPKGVRLLLVFRGFTGFFGLFGVYYSLQYLSLSDATVLTFLAPMCTAVSGAVLLGETITKKQAFAGVVSLVGVVLIARPVSLFGKPPHPGMGIEVPVAEEIIRLSRRGSGRSDVTSAQRLVAVGIALIGVLGATGAYTTLRAIGKRAHPLHALTSFSSQSIIVASTAMILTHEKVVIPTRLAWLAMLAMIGIFGFIAQVLLTMGLQRETASRGSMAVYTQIVFATIFEQIFFHALPSLLSAIGTMLILASAIYVAFTKPAPEAGQKSNSFGLSHVSDDSLEQGLLARGGGDDHRDDKHPQHEDERKQDDKHGRRSEDSDDLHEDHDITLPLFEGTPKATSSD